jgi:hypothetical protein
VPVALVACGEQRCTPRPVPPLATSDRPDRKIVETSGRLLPKLIVRSVTRCFANGSCHVAQIGHAGYSRLTPSATARPRRPYRTTRAPRTRPVPGSETSFSDDHACRRIYRLKLDRECHRLVHRPVRSPVHGQGCLRQAGLPALAPGDSLRRPGPPTLDPGALGSPGEPCDPSRAGGHQTASGGSRSYVRWGAPPGPARRGLAGTSLRDGKPHGTQPASGLA